MTTPNILLIALLSLASFFIFNSFHQWQQTMETQNQLDRCSGKIAIKMQKLLTMIETSNTVITAERTVVLATLPLPPANAAARAALKATVLLQKVQLLLLQSALALNMLIRCEGRFQTLNNPSSPYYRPLPDAI